ncbi:long-chain fatty acid transport protein 1-like [Danaus plexippus]|uniref:Very long-chain fatty acid transport protein n=1 Tax=Danaus plexippus plexippus TaxID=278856 RepID=A0A212EVU7_DANPL|nr:long-chain fatty acid transport protein 1-like [Danaus plexippus]OWR45591.1 fatty acid transport protein [Danaus plexippus plexippus]
MLAIISVGVSLLAALVYIGIIKTLLVSVVLGVLYTLKYHKRWCYIAIKTAPRDLRALYCYIKILLITRKFMRKDYTVPDIFHEIVVKHPKKPCFLLQDEVWTFEEVEEFSLRVSAVLKLKGVKKGDIVGLLVNNSPQMPALWLGNARLGGITPLINTNQRGNTLIHSISIAKCNVLIFSDEYLSVIQDISSQLDPKLKLLKFTHRPLNKNPVEVNGSGDGIEDLTDLLERTPPAPWTLADANGFQGRLLYIFTSGTTGLPKAAVISNSRFVFMACGLHNFRLNSSDVVYCPLPLYHTAGGVVSVGQALIFGCTVVLKTKFSASQYFPDCVKYKATAAHYIGEMCRYVLATPPSPADRNHRVRLIYGNGLRPQIWTEFVNRFNIQYVTEFYGATEGNANIANSDGTPGAIGFISRIFPAVYPIAIIKVDQETGEPIRDSRGLCQLAQPNEPGVFIGKISPNNPTREFLGYVDRSASDKKVVRDVFTHGDSAFISGDILVADEFGYLYFRDRTGDTFRWRGENVSTSEVEAAISNVANHRDAVVYGVMVPNTEGRAGMCGIVDTDGTLDLDKLAKDLSNDLPPYARPIFLRVMTSLDMTGTFKMKKTDLQKEGFDPSKAKGDKLYYLDMKQCKYLPLQEDEYNKIIDGRIRI